MPSELVSNHQNIFLYELYGVVIHHGGTLNGGHYTALAKNPRAEWYMFDDSRVQRTGCGGKAGGAYMLFYRKRRVENQLGYRSGLVSRGESVVLGNIQKNLVGGVGGGDLLDLRKGGGGGGGVVGDGGGGGGGSGKSVKYSTWFVDGDGDEPPSGSPRGRK
jgi:hypothetical protein